MGIDFHGLRLLVDNRSRRGGLGETIMLGRQELHHPDWAIREMLGAGNAYEHGIYCVHLLKTWFGATTVDSLDASEFEGANVIHDLNDEVPPTLWERYDAVLDFGTCEHIFNIPQALRNCSLMCRPGGVIMHVLPANHACGHGFWQFSPEVFLSLYAPRRGYAESQVYTADMDEVANVVEWFRNDEGRRLMPVSPNRLYLVARAVRADGPFSHGNVQQSDYLHLWGAGR